MPWRGDGAARCPLHVAFHGCLQSLGKINTTFVEHAGYNAWAEANGIVVLYPQATANALNPKGCWDWPVMILQRTLAD